MKILLTILASFAIFASSVGANDQLNQYRRDNGRDAWTWNAKLQKSAQESAYLIATGKRAWKHDGAWRISKYYGKYVQVSENLARKYSSFDEVMAAWKSSPSHNMVLLQGNTCEYGLGHYGDVYVLHTGCKYAK